jgi:hypothetical protein
MNIKNTKFKTMHRMKKTIFLFLIALVAVSCQGPVGPEGPQGYGTNWKIINLTANASDWVQKTDNQGLNRYYTCHFSMPEINSTVFNDGTVIAYFVNNGTQQNLPYVLHLENSTGNLWTRTIDCDYSVGGMNVYVTNSDFAIDPPQAMNFRVVLMW